MSRIYPYPKTAAAIIADAPKPGCNRHQWIFRVARELLKYFAPEYVQRTLERIALEMGWTDRDFAAEIAEAIEKIEATAGRPRSRAFSPARTPAWPQVDDAERHRRATATRPLFDLSPKPVTAAQAIERLFRPSELVCVAPNRKVFRTWPRPLAIEGAERNAFIVPNPMRKPFGLTRSGRMSARTALNASDVADVRHLVVEFDQGEPLEAQAAVLSSLHAPATPLAMAVLSGGKSVHGWFDVSRLTPGLKRRFFALAVHLGADPGLWSPCQLARMPGGLRENGARQHIVHFTPRETEK